MSDMVKYLDYIADLGYNSVELMPFNEFGGKRDWGYTPDYYFSGAEAYGFEMPRSEAVERGLIKPDQDKDKESVWINGTDAIKVFVDEAHKKGLNVICDVVSADGKGGKIYRKTVFKCCDACCSAAYVNDCCA